MDRQSKLQLAKKKLLKFQKLKNSKPLAANQDKKELTATAADTAISNPDIQESQVELLPIHQEQATIQDHTQENSLPSVFDGPIPFGDGNGNGDTAAANVDDEQMFPVDLVGQSEQFELFPRKMQTSSSGLGGDGIESNSAAGSVIPFDDKTTLVQASSLASPQMPPGAYGDNDNDIQTTTTASLFPDENQANSIEFLGFEERPIEEQVDAQLPPESFAKSSNDALAAVLDDATVDPLGTTRNRQFTREDSDQKVISTSKQFTSSLEAEYQSSNHLQQPIESEVCSGELYISTQDPQQELVTSPTQKLKQLSVKIDEQQNLLSSKDSIIQDLSEQLKAALSKNETIISQNNQNISDKISKYEDLEDDIEHLKIENRQLNDKAVHLESQLQVSQNYQNEISTLKNVIREDEQRINELEHRNTQNEAAFEDLEMLKEKMDHQITQLVAKSSKLETLVEEKDQVLENLRASSEIIKARLSSTLGIRDNHPNEIDSLVSLLEEKYHSSNQTISNLEFQIGLLRQENSNGGTSSNGNFGKKYEDISMQLSDMQNAYTSLINQIKYVDNIILQQKGGPIPVDSNAVCQVTELQELFKHVISTYQNLYADIQRANNEARNFKTLVAELESQKNVLEEQIGGMSEALKQKDFQVRSANSSPNTKQLDAINKENESLRIKISELMEKSQKFEEIHDQNKQNEWKLSQMEADWQSERKRSETLIRENETYRTKLIANEKLISDLREEISQIKESGSQVIKMQQLESEKQELEKISKSVTDDLEMALEKISQLEQQINHHNDQAIDVKEIFGEISMLIRRYGEFQSSVQATDKQSVLANLEICFESFRSKSENLASQLEILENQELRRLRDEVENLKKYTEHLEKTIESMKLEKSFNLDSGDNINQASNPEEDNLVLKNNLDHAHEHIGRLLKHVEQTESSYQKQLEIKISEIAALEDEIINLRKNKRYEAHNQQQQIYPNHADTMKLEEEIGNLKRDLAGKSLEIQQLRMEEVNSKSTVADLNRQSNELEFSLRQASNTIKMLNDELEKKQKEIYRLNMNKQFADKKSFASSENSLPTSPRENDTQPKYKDFEILERVLKENDKEIASLKFSLKKIMDDKAEAYASTADDSQKMLRKRIQQLNSMWDNEVSVNNSLRTILKEMQEKINNSWIDSTQTANRSEAEVSLDNENSSRKVEVLNNTDAQNRISELQAALKNYKFQIMELKDEKFALEQAINSQAPPSDIDLNFRGKEILTHRFEEEKARLFAKFKEKIEELESANRKQMDLIKKLRKQEKSQALEPSPNNYHNNRGNRGIDLFTLHQDIVALRKEQRVLNENLQANRLDKSAHSKRFRTIQDQLEEKGSQLQDISQDLEKSNFVKNLELKKLKHMINSLSTDLVKYKVKYRREAGYRSDLAYQKSFLLLVLDNFAQKHKNTHDNTFIGYELLASSLKPSAKHSTPNFKLRKCLAVVRSIARLRILRNNWINSKSVKKLQNAHQN